jgi:hypothetical protein
MDCYEAVARESLSRVLSPGVKSALALHSLVVPKQGNSTRVESITAHRVLHGQPKLPCDAHVNCSPSARTVAFHIWRRDGLCKDRAAQGRISAKLRQGC